MPVAPPHSHAAKKSEPAAAADGRGRWLSLLVACLGMMMTFFNITATISVLALAQAEWHASASSLVWISSTYALLVASFVLSAGTFGDLLGRRRMFLVGVLLMGAGSLLAFLSGAIAVLIAGQAVMGLGGAMVLPNSLSLVTSTFHDPHERTEAVSIWVGFSGIGLALGPVLSGTLLLHFSWHSVYLLNVGLALVTAVLAPILLAESRQPGRALDARGLVLGTIAIGLLTYTVIEGGEAGYTSLRTTVAFAGFLIALLAFLRFEARHHDPMLDLTLFRSASFSAVMGVAIAAMFTFTGIALLLVLYFEKVRHLSALGTGWRLLPMFAGYILCSAVAGRVVRRAGFRLTLTAGLLIAGVGGLLLLRESAGGGYVDIWPGMVVLGLGSGLLLAPSTAAAMISVPPAQAGMASATVNMFRQLGSVLGTSVLGTVLTTRLDTDLAHRLQASRVPGPIAGAVRKAVSQGAPSGSLPQSLAARVTSAVAQAFTDAQHTAILIAAVVMLVTAVPTVLLVRRRPPTR